MYAIPNLQDYLKFVTINFGMNSLITQLTPRQLIEGYTDEVLLAVKEAEPYRGGDESLNPFIKGGFPQFDFEIQN